MYYGSPKQLEYTYPLGILIQLSRWNGIHEPMCKINGSFVFIP